MSSVTATTATVSVTAAGSGAAAGAYDEVRVTACSNPADQSTCTRATCAKANAAACVVGPLEEGAAHSVTAVLISSSVVVSKASPQQSAAPLHP